MPLAYAFTSSPSFVATTTVATTVIRVAQHMLSNAGSLMSHPGLLGLEVLRWKLM